MPARGVRRSSSLAALAALLSPALNAQRPLTNADVLLHVVGEERGDWFGAAVASVGDVDGDGACDFAVGAHQNWSSGRDSPLWGRPGYVRLFSGADGTTLGTLTPRNDLFPEQPGSHFGHSLATLEDVNGDGLRELAVGAYLSDTRRIDCGAVYLHSGPGEVPLRIWRGEFAGDRLGFSIAVVPDRDGDGRSDLAFGSPKEDTLVYNGGNVRVVSSATGATLLDVDGSCPGGLLGYSLASVGDLDGDGVADLLAGAFVCDRDEKLAEDGEGLDEEGLVVALSGASGERLLCWRGAEELDYLGSSVASLGDLDGDGLDELALGASQSSFTGVYSGAGQVRVVRGRDGGPLYTMWGEAPGDQFGWCLVPTDDSDGDGRRELLVGAPSSINVGPTTTGRPGRVELRSGANGARLAALLGLAPDDQFGAAVAVLEDLDGDGLPEVLVGAPENVPGQTRPGYAVVLRGRALSSPESR